MCGKKNVSCGKKNRKLVLCSCFTALVVVIMIINVLFYNKLNMVISMLCDGVITQQDGVGWCFSVQEESLLH